ncbi:hypothetical protein DY000_02033088 [Brassica cretica]|uniref:Uncharacterized protein n=1 Tax=Brassica cretica TaxID=69181 RepID=A0ABQ7DKM9_BRACR|nr:hypothetical protein DY000_02033088 [Brassica cretica]
MEHLRSITLSSYHDKDFIRARFAKERVDMKIGREFTFLDLSGLKKPPDGPTLFPIREKTSSWAKILQKSMGLLATPYRRKICVVQPEEYGAYKDEHGNAQTMDGRIINVSKEDIKAMLEMQNIQGGKYLSIPQCEGCFKMLGVHPTPPYPPEDIYGRDEVKELIEKVWKDQEKNI